MFILSKFMKKVRGISAKQAVIAGVFTLMLVGSAGMGLSARQQADASGVRDCSVNSIINRNHVSGNNCGAHSASELVSDINRNSNSDLKNIFSHTGLKPGDYNRFKKEAKNGVVKKNGDLVVGGQVVMKNVWTMGRTTLGGSQRTPIKISGKTYYHSHPRDSFAASQIDALVLFDSKGSVQFAVLKACGNPVTKGKKVTSGAKCEILNKKAVSGKLNTYKFTTNTSTFGFGKVTKVEYFLDGKKIGQSTNSGKKYEFTHTFTKSGTVTAKVTAKVPGGKTVTVTSSKCKQKITVKKPFYECKALHRAIREEEADHVTYRFAAESRQGNGASLKNADFIVNGKTVATNVTSKENGNIYRDIKLERGQSYTIEAKLKFTVNGKTVEAKEVCKSKVSPKKLHYACDLLKPKALNDELTKFRFTVVASMSDKVELKDADFATWKVGDEGNKTTVEGVNTRDEDGNIYHEYEFDADGQARVVEATVNFDILGSAKSVKCKAEVTPKEAPKCPIPGKEHLPADSDECKEDEKPEPKEEPKEEPREEPKEEVMGKELPKTGAASVFGIFASATGAGAAIHRLISRRLS